MSNEDDIARINGIISPLVKNGQSLHQIYLAHVDELMCSEKTLYNYVDAQLFDIRNIDLPRKVKYRPRYKKPEFKVDRGCRIERSYADFQKYLGANPETTIVQMDSVIGRVGGKCLLTIHFGAAQKWYYLVSPKATKFKKCCNHQQSQEFTTLNNI